MNPFRLSSLWVAVIVTLMMLVFLSPLADATASCESQVISTNSTDVSRLPSIVVDSNGVVHVVWQDETNYTGSGMDEDIFYMNLSGGVWSETQVVSTDSTNDSFEPIIAIGPDNTVHVVWYDYTNYSDSGDDIDIFYKNLSGGVWSETQVVSTESIYDSYCPFVTVDSNGVVHVVWQEYNLSLGSSTEIAYKNLSGGVWSATELVFTGSADCDYPSIAIGSNGVAHVVWHDYSNYSDSGDDLDIFYKNRSGGVWSETQVVSTDSTNKSAFPVIAVGSNDVLHVVWHDYSNYSDSGDDSDIFYKNFNGGVWSETQVVSIEGTEYSEFPAIAVGSNDVLHVVWHDYSNYSDSGDDSDIFYKCLSGGVWTEAMVISTESTGESLFPRIAVGSNDVLHVVWHDETNLTGSGTDYDIFYKMLDNTPVADDDISLYAIGGVAIIIAIIVAMVIIRMRS